MQKKNGGCILLIYQTLTSQLIAQKKVGMGFDSMLFRGRRDFISAPITAQSDRHEV
ncbi:hypothetical protein BVAD3_38950 [Bacillus velezensis]|nr:hypothetical protein BVAD3_38950 [Bacillus velezensis]